jgi:hypothetical protein
MMKLCALACVCVCEGVVYFAWFVLLCCVGVIMVGLGVGGLMLSCRRFVELVRSFAQIVRGLFVLVVVIQLRP